MSQPREWLIKEAFVGKESGTRYPAHVTSDLSYGSYEGDMIHVVERSALDAALAREKVLVEALEFSLQGLAMWRKYQSPGNVTEIEERIRETLATVREMRAK